MGSTKILQAKKHNEKNIRLSRKKAIRDIVIKELVKFIYSTSDEALKKRYSSFLSIITKISSKDLMNKPIKVPLLWKFDPQINLYAYRLRNDRWITFEIKGNQVILTNIINPEVNK